MKHKRRSQISPTVCFDSLSQSWHCVAVKKIRKYHHQKYLVFIPFSFFLCFPTFSFIAVMCYFYYFHACFCSDGATSTKCPFLPVCGLKKQNKKKSLSTLLYFPSWQKKKHPLGHFSILNDLRKTVRTMELRKKTTLYEGDLTREWGLMVNKYKKKMRARVCH